MLTLCSRYLWPFLRNFWDSERALAQLANHTIQPRILLLAAGKDEVVPASEADYLHEVCRRAGLKVQRKDVLGALHNEASSKFDGKRAVVDYLRDLNELRQMGNTSL